MAEYHGNSGKVLIASAEVANVQNWNYNEEEEIAEYSSIGDTSMSYKASGLQKGGGDIDVIFDDDDATGQQALTIGDEVVLHLTTADGVTGKVEWTGTAMITSRGVSSPKGDMITQSYSFVGVLAEGDVPA